MSKTFETNAGKALSLAKGLRNNFEEVARLGITKEQIDRIETEANRAIEMSREVDSLREVVSQKLQSANDLLAEVKEQANQCRTLIKSNYPLEAWERFGLTDKR